MISIVSEDDLQFEFDRKFRLIESEWAKDVVEQIKFEYSLDWIYRPENEYHWEDIRISYNQKSFAIWKEYKAIKILQIAPHIYHEFSKPLGCVEDIWFHYPELRGFFK